MSDADEPPAAEVVRLSVNITRLVADEIRRHMAMFACNATEATRKAFTLLKIYNDVVVAGKELSVVSYDDPDNPTKPTGIEIIRLVP